MCWVDPRLINKQPQVRCKLVCEAAVVRIGGTAWKAVKTHWIGNKVYDHHQLGTLGKLNNAYCTCFILFHLVFICRKSPKGSTQVRNVVAFTYTPFKSKRILLLVTSTDFLHFNFFSSCRGIICLLAWQRQCWRLSISSFGNRTQILQGVPLRSALTISHYLSLRTEATVIQSQVETCWFFIGTKNLQSSSVTVSQSFTARRLAGPCWVVEVERWAKFQWAAADFRLCLCNLDSLIFHLSNSGAAGNPWNKVFECQVMWGKQHSKMDWSEGEWSLHSQSHFAVSCLVV